MWDNVLSIKNLYQTLRNGSPKYLHTMVLNLITSKLKTIFDDLNYFCIFLCKLNNPIWICSN